MRLRLVARAVIEVEHGGRAVRILRGGTDAPTGTDADDEVRLFREGRREGEPIPLILVAARFAEVIALIIVQHPGAFKAHGDFPGAEERVRLLEGIGEEQIEAAHIPAVLDDFLQGGDSLYEGFIGPGPLAGQGFIYLVRTGVMAEEDADRPFETRRAFAEGRAHHHQSGVANGIGQGV